MQKWSKTIMAGLIAGTLLLGSLPALAQSTYDPRIDAREQNQQQRIQQGVQSGRLNQREANHLEAQQGRIQAREDRLKADGNLTGAERARLTRQENLSSRNIYRKKHNERTAASQ